MSDLSQIELLARQALGMIDSKININTSLTTSIKDRFNRSSYGTDVEFALIDRNSDGYGLSFTLGDYNIPPIAT